MSTDYVPLMNTQYLYYVHSYVLNGRISMVGVDYVDNIMTFLTTPTHPPS